MLGKVEGSVRRKEANSGDSQKAHRVWRAKSSHRQKLLSSAQGDGTFPVSTALHTQRGSSAMLAAGKEM